MKNVKTMIKTEYEKTLPEYKKTKKLSVSHAAGKLLALFFTLMLIFTIVTRAMASITVARVTVSYPQRDSLIYLIEGTGEIIPEEEKHIRVLPGYRISEVDVKAGEVIDQGTVLYSYSMEDLKDKYTSIQNEIKKIELLIEEERLRQQPSEMKPLKSQLLSQKQAKDNLKAAIKKLDETQKDYENSRNSTKEKLLENKEKEYDEAVKSYESLIYSQEKQLMLSDRAVKDAITALDETGETKARIEQLINNYKDAVVSKDKLYTYLSQVAIYEAFYGSAENYEKHKDAVYTKAIEALGDGSYLLKLQNYILNYEEQIYDLKDELQKAQNSSDPSINSEQNKKTLSEQYESAVNAYLTYLEEYEQQINLIEGLYGKESNELKKLRRNDKQLKDYLTQFYISIDRGADSEAQEKNLFDFLYEDHKKEIEQDVKEKTLTLTRAEEDYKLLEKEFEIARADLQEKSTELKNAIKCMKAGTYDYEEALEGKKQEVEAAKEAVRIAKQAVELHNLKEDAPSDKNTKRISDLVIQSNTIDLDAKKQELNKVKLLMKDSGEVRSPNKGVVTLVGVESGKTTTGEEMINLGSGDYVFKAEFDRKNAANIADGVKANIVLESNDVEFEVEIEKIDSLENGMSELTARMPEGEYILGEKAEFKITSQSKQFELCIPIQSLREDSYGNYVLIPREQEDILGTQLIADRIDVTILGKSSKTVAVDGALNSRIQVIKDSNKYINRGDRIRIDG